MLPAFPQALPGRGSILAGIGEPAIDGASRGLTVRGYSFSAPLLMAKRGRSTGLRQSGITRASLRR